MNYNSLVYKKLTDSNAMADLPMKHSNELLGLGNIICQHNLEDHVGVTLAHRHHDLKSNERMLWQIEGNRIVGKPEQVEDGSIFPINFKFDVAFSKGEWRPLEFLPNNTSYSLEKQQIDRIVSNEKFQKDFQSFLLDNSLQDVFGFGLLPCREYFNQPNTTLLERSSLSKRMSWVEKTTEEDVAPISGGVTVWKFKKGDVHSAQKCWQGNSQHCCGA